MISVQCPHCLQTTHTDPAMAGQAATCPACGGEFTVPFVVEQPTIRRSAGRPAAKKRKARRHWAKTAMLITTAIWPVAAILLSLLMCVSAAADYRDLGNGYHRKLTFPVDVISDGELGAIYVGLVFTAGMFATILYFLAMFVLLVVWFATKDE